MISRFRSKVIRAFSDLFTQLLMREHLILSMMMMMILLFILRFFLLIKFMVIIRASAVAILAMFIASRNFNACIRCTCLVRLGSCVRLGTIAIVILS